MRTSTENIFKDLEDEVKTSEKSVVHEDAFTMQASPMTTTSRNTSPKPVRSEISEAEIMSTVLRWDLKYNGNDSDLMDFLERFEELAECYQIPLDRLLPSLLGVLNGYALKWYRVKRQEISSWDIFKLEAQKFFLPKRYLERI